VAYLRVCHRCDEMGTRYTTPYITQGIAVCLECQEAEAREAEIMDLVLHGLHLCQGGADDSAIEEIDCELEAKIAAYGEVKAAIAKAKGTNDD
jgi:hypothetical protein